MDKRIISRHIIVYTGSAISFSLLFSKKNCPAQKEINIDPVETKSNVRPSRSLQTALKYIHIERLERV